MKRGNNIKSRILEYNGFYFPQVYSGSLLFKRWFYVNIEAGPEYSLVAQLPLVIPTFNKSVEVANELLDRYVESLRKELGVEEYVFEQPQPTNYTILNKRTVRL